MKARLEFNLPADSEEHKSALNGSRYLAMLDDMDNYLRSELKYNDKLTDEQYAVFEKIRAKLIEIRYE